MPELIPEALVDVNYLQDTVSMTASFPDNYQDMFINLANASSRFVLNYCKRKSFKYKTVSNERHDGGDSDKLLTDYFPLISVTSLYDDVSRDFETSSLVTTDNYDISDSDAGIIRRNDQRFTRGRANVQISYVAGYSDFEITEGVSDKIIINEGVSDITVSLTEGVYNASGLATQLQTDINANITTSSDYTATYSETSHRIKISKGAGTFSLPWTNVSTENKIIGRQLGYNTNSDSAAASVQIPTYPMLGVPDDLIDTVGSIVRWRYEEIQERRLGKTSSSSDMESVSFDFSRLPAFIISNLSHYQLRRL